MPRYSIIIPVCGNEKVTEECLESVYKNTLDFEIIIVDNGSDWQWSGPAKIIRNDTNLGFPKAVNQGIKEAAGEVIVVLNNDTIVTPNWLEHLTAHFDKFDIAGPVTNNISGPQQIELDIPLEKDNLDVIAADIYSKNYQRAHPYHRLVFFCVAIKRAVIDQIGLLDEQFSPGNFEDDDFCLRAIEAGFRLGIAQDAFIYHIGSMTHKSLNLNVAELLEGNRVKFQAKWPSEKYLDLQAKCLDNCHPAGPVVADSLALVMIVKNEEVGLERAIQSCRDFASEIVIAIDNSTTDKTEEIAKKYTSNI
jgi:GT2 family glycosyltransferase